MQQRRVPAPAVGLLTGGVDADPRVALHVEEVDVHEDGRGLATPDHAEVALVYSRRRVARTGGRRGLAGDGREEPGAR